MALLKFPRFTALPARSSPVALYRHSRPGGTQSHISGPRVASTTSCGRISLDPQGEIAYTLTPKKGLLIILYSDPKKGTSYHPPLKISIQDLFRFWWNRCIDQYLAVDEILEDIYQYFTEEMRPPQEEPQEMDLTVDFGQMRLFGTEQEEAA